MLSRNYKLQQKQDETNGQATGEAKKYRAQRNREEKNYRTLDEFKDRIAPDTITSLEKNEIFVFGSNLDGMHAHRLRHRRLPRRGDSPAVRPRHQPPQHLPSAEFLEGTGGMIGGWRVEI